MRLRLGACVSALRGERVFTRLNDVFLLAAHVKLGERQCHLVFLSEEDTVEWDDELPPALGELAVQGNPPLCVRGCGWVAPAGAYVLPHSHPQHPPVSLFEIEREPRHHQSGAERARFQTHQNRH